MARFNSEMYEKLYPRNEPTETEPIETAAETFTPTADIDNSAGSDNDAGDTTNGDAGDCDSAIE